VLLPDIESRFIPRGSAKPVVNFTESRMKLGNATNLDRKSGNVGPRL
jgi:hypothetical protein